MAFGATDAQRPRIAGADAELTEIATASDTTGGVGTALTTLLTGLAVWTALVVGVPAVHSGRLERTAPCRDRVDPPGGLRARRRPAGRHAVPRAGAPLRRQGLRRSRHPCTGGRTGSRPRGPAAAPPAGAGVAGPVPPGGTMGARRGRSRPPPGRRSGSSVRVERASRPWRRSCCGSWPTRAGRWPWTRWSWPPSTVATSAR